MVALWQKRESSIHVLSQSVVHNETITSVFVSEEYGIALSCSRDGKLAILRLPNLDLIRLIELNLPETVFPRHVVVQHGMGYITVFCEEESIQRKATIVKNFTINGLDICTVTFDLYFLNIIANITEDAEWLKYITPFGYAEAADILTNAEISPAPAAVGCAVTAAGIAAAFFKYCRKDIY